MKQTSTNKMERSDQHEWSPNVNKVHKTPSNSDVNSGVGTRQPSTKND